MRLGSTSAPAFALVGRRRNYYSGRDGAAYDALTLAKIVATARLSHGSLHFGLVKTAKTDLSAIVPVRANGSRIL